MSKRYEAEIEGIVTEEDIHEFSQGLDLGDFVAQPAQLIIHSIDEETNRSWIEVEIWEGKFHQVKRMFEKVDKKVLTLKRRSMGPLELEADLEEGMWRELNEDEKNALIPFGYE